MLGVVALVLQTPPLFPDKVTEPPAQNVVAPTAEIVDAIGKAYTLTSLSLQSPCPLAGKVLV